MTRFAYFSFCTAFLITIGALIGVASTLFQPQMATGSLYRVYKACDVIFPAACIALALFSGGIWLMVSRSRELKKAFNRAFRDNQRVFRAVAIVVFAVFLLTGARAVKQQGGTWEFTGKGDKP